jgi:hypothetical protein
MEKPLVVNATIFWACLDHKNDMSGKYQVDLTNLTDAAVKEIEMRGMKVANKGDDRNSFITVKSNNPIKAYDTNGTEVGFAVGNGSKAKCVLGSYDWTFKTKAGRSPSLLKLVITDLVVYDDGNGDSSYDLDEAV